jgi:hypothetical protein
MHGTDQESIMRKLLNLPVFALVLGIAPAANATTWHVDAAGGADATTIQAGINLSSSGDVVIVAPGTYSGVGNRNINFLGRNITVMSQSGPQQTIVDCQGLGLGFQFLSNETTAAVLDGFTIKNGSANKGGGVLIDTASPTIRYCVITNCNVTGVGGGISVKKGDPDIYNCTLDGNGAALGGGGIVLGAQSHAKLWQNIICNSTVGGGVNCFGAMTGTSLDCNDVYNNTGGDAVCFATPTNFSQDPLYCGIPGSGNFSLQQTSPCAATYSPCLAAVGALGPQCQVTAIQPTSWGSVKAMYR